MKNQPRNSFSARKTAFCLMLAVLCFLSAVTLSGCDYIKDTAYHLVEEWKNEELYYKYFAVEPYAEPITRTPEEIRESGITAEDVLAEFDRLAWDINLIRYTRSIKENCPDKWEQIVRDSQTSAQFVKITPEHDGRNFDYYPIYGMITTHEGYYDFFSTLTQGKEPKHFQGVYPIQIHYNDVTYGHQNGHQSEIPNSLTIGVYKDQFQPVGDFMADERFMLTLDKIDQIVAPFGGGDSHYYDFKNSQGYSAFEITRETIKNASQEELYALYDLARSIRAISIELEYPDFAPINQDLQ